VIDHGIDADKVHVWQRGIDAGRFSPGDRTEARRRLGLPVAGSVLLWVGRIVPVKGLDVLLRACLLLRQRDLAFRLYLVGDGELRGALEAQVQGLGLAGTVSFMGAQPHDQLPDWFRAADLTVLPSLSEGLPNVLRESLACATPFVASRVGGIPEMASEPFDRLVPPGDPEALAEAIAYKLLAPSQQPPTAARTRSWEEEAESLVEILRSYQPCHSVTAPLHTVELLA
jgi:glycosyltransferase involved in cell wall biosynthesis